MLAKATRRILRLVVAVMSLSGAGACLRYPDGGADSGLPAAVDATHGMLSGQILDPSGAPLADAYLTTLPRGYEARSDADGHFEIDRLPPDRYRVVAAAEGLDSSTSDEVELWAGQTAQVNLALSAAAEGGVLQVRLLGPDDQPLAFASVSTSTGATGSTDEDGLLVLTGVVGDDVQVVLGDDARTWPATVEGLSITAAGGAQLALQLSGRPTDGATYQGAAWCSACHGDVAADHAGTHHADALSTSIDGDLLAAFQAEELVDLGAAQARLSLDADTPQVTLVAADSSEQTWPVAGLIASPDSRAVPWVDDGDQGWPLPLAWIAADTGREPDYPDGQARFVPYQLSRWLDEDGHFVDLDPAESAEASCFPCHAVGFELSPRDDGGVDMSAVDGDGRWTDAGVQCEACHGPGSAHVSADAADRAFTITSPELLQTVRANQVCGQCHSRTTGVGTDLPYPLSDDGWFQPGQDLGAFSTSAAEHWPSGAAAAGSQQLDELRLSPHGDGGPLAMGCLDCHTAHGVDADGDAWPHQGVADLDDNSLCLGCHLELSFDGDADGPSQHAAHARYDPEADHQSGRCAGCHMPATAAVVGFSERSGAGDASSHLFAIWPPQDTVDAFDAAGAETLAAGTFPMHGCAECHDYARWYWEEIWDATFPGVAGDPTDRQTHVDHQAAYADKFGEGAR